MKVILLAAALLAVPLTVPLTAPAQAAPHHDAVRYASIKGCDRGDDGRLPCGPWRLVMHSGEQRVLADAQTVALKADGKPYKYLPAPVAVSGDGTKVAYFAKNSHRLAVRTLGGGVTLLPAGAVPRVPQYEVGLVLSDDGGRLAVTIGTGQVRIFDTSDGARLGTLPRGETLVDFSGDGGEVLTTVDADESVTDVVVRADTGELVSRATPPQLVSANMPLALAADGRTAAAFVAGKSQLVLYDVETDQVLGRVPVKLPKGDLNAIDWTGDRQVTLHLTTQAGRMNVVQIDTGTGAVRLRDRYTVLKDSLVVAACGG
jgi:DNA-binding beta-propeller fold protein YncE